MNPIITYKSKDGNVFAVTLKELRLITNESLVPVQVSEFFKDGVEIICISFSIYGA